MASIKNSVSVYAFCLSGSSLRVSGIYVWTSLSAQGTEEVSKDLLAALYANCPCYSDPDSGTQIENLISFWNQPVLLEGFQ